MKEHPKVFNHVGLLENWPLTIEPPFFGSSDNLRFRHRKNIYGADYNLYIKDEFSNANCRLITESPGISLILRSGRQAMIVSASDGLSIGCLHQQCSHRLRVRSPLTAKAADQSTDVGCDRGKRLNGQKNLVTDALGLLLLFSVAATKIENTTVADPRLRDYINDARRWN